MKQYLEALTYVLENGTDGNDRTGVGTRSIFGYQMRFNLQEGFPAVTTKKLAWKSVVSELLWFLEGSTDERRLAEILYSKPRKDIVEKTTIWTANANNQGIQLGLTNNEVIKELGPVYGYQWRSFGKSYNGKAGLHYGIDQVKNLIKEIKTNPDSRRLILTAWNPAQTLQMALPPCHLLAQFRVTNGRLSCLLYQRSCDMFLGVPFNIASYALLTHIIAALCNLQVGDFIWSGGDCHIYNNHMNQVKEQLTRQPYNLPKLVMPEVNNIEDLKLVKVSSFVLSNYKHHETITATMAV